MPALPKVFTHVSTYPAFQPLYASPLLANAKVAPPTSDILLPAFDTIFQRDAFLGMLLAPYLILEPVQTGLSRCNTSVAIDTKPQKLTIPGMSNTALVGIDAQF